VTLCFQCLHSLAPFRRTSCFSPVPFWSTAMRPAGKGCFQLLIRGPNFSLLQALVAVFYFVAHAVCRSRHYFKKTSSSPSPPSFPRTGSSRPPRALESVFSSFFSPRPRMASFSTRVWIFRLSPNREVPCPPWTPGAAKPSPPSPHPSRSSFFFQKSLRPHLGAIRCFRLRFDESRTSARPSWFPIPSDGLVYTDRRRPLVSPLTVALELPPPPRFFDYFFAPPSIATTSTKMLTMGL